ncbi:hypothetical protein NLJ89_g5404 [Agrocybe chaxingu]|uniref:Uncharacterized protein n=1 Tax=Agrocybe chaxingu TaxID=84603 RepID=A0A9W8MV17_9AGAR|nr:hypothetical protein NLJ89_g5404 [Agrocybe chaxingu]
MPKDTKKTTTRKPSGRTKCPLNCGKEVSVRGLQNHVKACERAAGTRALISSISSARLQQLGSEDQSDFVQGSSRRSDPPIGTGLETYWAQDSEIASAAPDSDTAAAQPYMDIDPGSPQQQPPGVQDNPTIPNLKRDDIKIEYHPKSGRHGAPTIHHFDEYVSANHSTCAAPTPDPEPWKPFRTRLDFELAEFMQDARLNEEQIGDLLSLISRCIKSPESLTISGADDLANVWKHARETKAFGFKQCGIKAPYKNEDVEFNVSLDEDSGETGKKGYVNFKRVVWHQGVYEILKSIIPISKTGHWVPCGDGIDRWIFTLLLILCADYEEQSIMALIRGLNSKAPCPICLVPDGQLTDLSIDFPLRTVEEMQNIFNDAQELNKGMAEELMKSYGLRNIKVVMFAAFDILSEESTGAGRILMKLLRSYLELDIITSLSVHTESTLAAGEAELKVFENLLKEYFQLYPNKSWDFPKAHTHKHVFADILRKGVTKNFNTKPNEKAHGPLKEIYQLLTNFKNFIEQILKFSENDLISVMIRDAINLLDNFVSEAQLEGSSEESANKVATKTRVGSEHISLRSVQPSICLFKIEEEHSEDLAFKDFRKKLSKYFTSQYNKQIRLTQYAEICPYQLLEVNYESKIDWRTKTDLLHANPNFHNRPRYDFILVDAGPAKSTNNSGSIPSQDLPDTVPEHEYFFAQLLYIFEIQEAGKAHHMALILPFDEPIPIQERPQADDDFHFTRLRHRHRAKSAFIDVETIVRGAVLIPARDIQYDDEYLVFNVLDEDIWMRMRTIQLASSVALQ